jgi:hypothetical protein
MSRHSAPEVMAVVGYQGNVKFDQGVQTPGWPPSPRGMGPFLSLGRHTGSSSLHGPLPLYGILTEMLRAREEATP